MIFNTIVNPTRQEAVADQIVRLGNQTLLQLTATYLRAYDLVWKDPDPAGVIAALRHAGPSGLHALGRAGSLHQLLRPNPSRRRGACGLDRHVQCRRLGDGGANNKLKY